MGSVMERLCCLRWWSTSSSRKATTRETNGDDDALIEGIDLPVQRSSGDALSWFRLPDRRRVHQSRDNDAGISIVSHGKIKYVKDASLASHVAVPIIDPLIGRGTEASSHQRLQLFPRLQLRGAAVRRSIFHFHYRQHERQQWWDAATPPSSVDLEWEHEGLMAPEEEAASDASECQSSDEEAGVGAAGPSSMRRSPSPASACHSLEWDGDDFAALAHQQAGAHFYRQPVARKDAPLADR